MSDAPAKHHGLTARRVVVLAFVSIAILPIACGRVNAVREFNYGVKYYEDGNFPAAVRAFARASVALDRPEPHYDLALAYLAHLRRLDRDPDSAHSKSTGKPIARREAIEGGLDAVADALTLTELSRSMEARLHFVAGEIHRLAGERDQAREAFERSLGVHSSYAPALRALVEMDPGSDALLTRLVLATAVVDPPTLEKTLPP